MGALIAMGVAFTVLGLVAFNAKKKGIPVPATIEPAPAPKSPGTPQVKPKADMSAECKKALDEWMKRANYANLVCEEAAVVANEWWRIQDRIDAGEEFSGDEEQQAILQRDWEALAEECDLANQISLAAMAEYEALSCPGPTTSGRRYRRRRRAA